MKADFNTMPRVYRECNNKYFDHSLPTPKFGLFNKKNTFAEFSWNWDKKNKKCPIKNQKIMFTDCYDFDERDFIDIMVHEMIHYYIALNGIKDNNDHGNEFQRIMNELNEKYGLNVEIKKNASSFKKTENAPKYDNPILKFIFG